MLDRQTLHDAAWLVSRGVRPLATVEPTVAPDAESLAESWRDLEAEAVEGAIPFVIERPGGRAIRGYAAQPWAVELARWLVGSGDTIPERHRDEIWGLLFGYGAEAIGRFSSSGGSPLNDLNSLTLSRVR